MLRALCVVHRHGARAPVYDVMSGSTAFVESWTNRAEAATKTKLLLGISADAKPNVALEHSHDPTAAAAEAPWGKLTQLGVAQTYLRGLLLGAAYTNAGHKLAPAQVLCSNFTRTYLSGACVAAGMAHAGAGAATPVQPSIDFSLVDDCPIAVFESRNGMMDFARDVMALPLYAEQEARFAAAQAALQDTIPAFKDGLGGGFNWIRAFDIFTSLGVHGDWGQLQDMQLHGQESLQAVWLPVAHHMLWRLNTLYAWDGAAPKTVGGLLATIRAKMEAHSMATSDAVPVYTFSGHDVTLLPLLSALSGSHAAAWPDFASAITLELWEGVSGESSVKWKFHNDALLAQPLEVQFDVQAVQAATGAGSAAEPLAEWLVPANTTGAALFGGQSHQKIDAVLQQVQGMLQQPQKLWDCMYSAPDDVEFAREVSPEKCAHPRFAHGSCSAAMSWEEFCALVHSVDPDSSASTGPAQN